MPCRVEATIAWLGDVLVRAGKFRLPFDEPPLANHVESAPGLQPRLFRPPGGECLTHD